MLSNVTCYLSGVQVQALVDTGSMKSFVSQDLFDKIRPKQQMQATHQRSLDHWNSITGEPLPVEGTVQASLSFPGNDSVLYSGTFLVSIRSFCYPN